MLLLLLRAASPAAPPGRETPATCSDSNGCLGWSLAVLLLVLLC